MTTSSSFKALRVPARFHNRLREGYRADKVYAGMPGMSCYPGGCGAIWATTLDRVHCELPPEHPVWSVKPAPVTPPEFQAIARAVRTSLGLPEDRVLWPGTNVGYIRVRPVGRVFPSFDAPVLQGTVITLPVLERLEREGITGWRGEPVHVVCPSADPIRQPLFELAVTGRGGRAETDVEVPLVSSCAVCGDIRYAVPKVLRLRVAEDQWDGSDLFRLDPPFHGYVLVSERLARVLEEARFTNYELVPLEDLYRPRCG